MSERMREKGTLYVFLRSATGLKQGDLIWSDPYVLARIGFREIRSRTLRCTRKPVWNETLTFDNMILGDVLRFGLKLSIFDQDAGGLLEKLSTDDDLLGEIHSQLAELTRTDQIDYRLPVPKPHRGTVEFSVRWHGLPPPPTQTPPPAAAAAPKGAAERGGDRTAGRGIPRGAATAATAATAARGATRQAPLGRAVRTAVPIGKMNTSLQRTQQLRSQRLLKLVIGGCCACCSLFILIVVLILNIVFATPPPPSSPPSPPLLPPSPSAPLLTTTPLSRIASPITQRPSSPSPNPPPTSPPPASAPFSPPTPPRSPPPSPLSPPPAPPPSPSPPPLPPPPPPPPPPSPPPSPPHAPGLAEAMSAIVEQGGSSSATVLLLGGGPAALVIGLLLVRAREQLRPGAAARNDDFVKMEDSESDDEDAGFVALPQRAQQSRAPRAPLHDGGGGGGCGGGSGVASACGYVDDRVANGAHAPTADLTPKKPDLTQLRSPSCTSSPQRRYPTPGAARTPIRRSSSYRSPAQRSHGRDSTLSEDLRVVDRYGNKPMGKDEALRAGARRGRATAQWCP